MTDTPTPPTPEAKLLTKEELEVLRDKKPLYFCNKCGHFGETGPRHLGCHYNAVTDDTVPRLLAHIVALESERTKILSLLKNAQMGLLRECAAEVALESAPPQPQEEEKSEAAIIEECHDIVDAAGVLNGGFEIQDRLRELVKCVSQPQPRDAGGDRAMEAAREIFAGAGSDVLVFDEDRQRAAAIIRRHVGARENNKPDLTLRVWSVKIGEKLDQSFHLMPPVFETEKQATDFIGAGIGRAIPVEVNIVALSAADGAKLDGAGEGEK